MLKNFFIVKKWATFLLTAGVFMTNACELLSAFEPAPTPASPVSALAVAIPHKKGSVLVLPG